MIILHLCSQGLGHGQRAIQLKFLALKEEMTCLDLNGGALLGSNTGKLWTILKGLFGKGQEGEGLEPEGEEEVTSHSIPLHYTSVSTISLIFQLDHLTT